MNRRGHALLLILCHSAAVGTLSAIFVTRLTTELHDRRAEEVRFQASWLARSALDAGVEGTRRVPTALGEASVVVARERGERVARVDLAGAVAVARADGSERYTRAVEGPPPPRQSLPR
jgi:type II secretory pathway component PulK